MSRTFAHRPFWAWLATPQACVPVHDHRDGSCDLVPRDVFLDQVRAGRPMWRIRSCRWEVDLHAVPPSCGCAMCTGHHERVADRRRDRRTVRLALRFWELDTDEL